MDEISLSLPFRRADLYYQRGLISLGAGDRLNRVSRELSIYIPHFGYVACVFTECVIYTVRELKIKED